MQEIGSEFQSTSAIVGQNTFCLAPSFADKRFVLSGRTGLAYIADELVKKYSVKSIALPAYCCASMIYPFLNKGISISFYPMPASLESAAGSHLSTIEKVIGGADAALIMDYFGFVRNFALSLATLSCAFGKVLIVDATQTAFSMADTYPLADYIMASYRKWSDILCAVVYSRDKLSAPNRDVSSGEYVHIWRKAAAIKKQYLSQKAFDKTEYLQLYDRANCMLSGSYENLTAADDEIARLNAIDSDALIDQRRKNAWHLINAIKSAGLPDLQLVFDHLEERDCPLFVPILVNEQKRNAIRRKLIEKDIYCPAHWPVDTDFPYCRTRYHNCEISLICDQRYGTEDMDRELKELFIVLSQ